MAEQHVGADQVPHVVEVGLEVGHEANVEIHALQFCLEAALQTPPFTGALPVITQRPGDVLRLAYLEVDDGDPNH